MKRILLIIFIGLTLPAISQTPVSPEIPTDSLRSLIVLQKDSLQYYLNFNDPASQAKQLKYLQGVDSLKMIMNSPDTVIRSTFHSMDDKKKKLMGLIPDTPEVNVPGADKITGKFEGLKRKLDQKLDLDRLDVSDKLNGLEDNIPDLDMSTPDINLPDVTLPDLPDFNDDLPKTPDLKTNMPEIPTIDGSIPDEVGEAREIIGQAKDIKNNPEQLETITEEQLRKMGAIEKLESQAAAAEKIKDMPAQYEDKYGRYGNTNAFKAQAQEELIKLAQTQFSDQQLQLMETQNKIGKYKRMYSKVNSIKDLPKQKRHSLKGKPFKERMNFGATLQLYRGDELTGLDFAPIIGYRINKLWTVNFSGSYRVTLKQHDLQNPDFGDTYSYRFFTQYTIWKIFLHGEYDVTRTNTQSLTTKELNREWVPSYTVGIGKPYRISKRIEGHVLTLYNLNHLYKTSSFDHAFMVRFGFYLKPRPTP